MRKQRGFTLIELLIVVAIIGIIAAIAIPNLLDAIERSKQKRTIADMNSMAGAIQSFATDMKGYPDFPGDVDPYIKFGGVDGAGWKSNKGTVKGNIFIPDYIQALPAHDGWGYNYHYDGAPEPTTFNAVSNEAIGYNTAMHFALWSGGNDGANTAAGDDSGAADGATIAGSWCANPPVVAGTTHTHCYKTDIVWCDASFMQSPDGKQKDCN
jgi:type II secretion system protein G